MNDQEVIQKIKQKYIPDSEDMKLANEVLSNLPTFDDFIYDNLPPLFDEILNPNYHKDNKKFKDIILMSSLVSLSSVFPKVTTPIFNSRPHSANLFWFLMGETGKGKGLASISNYILKSYLDREKNNNKILEDKYKEDCIAYKKSKSKKYSGTTYLEEPTPPPFTYHLMESSDLSEAKLKENLSKGGHFLFENESEQLTKNKKIGQWANYDTTLRKIWGHDPINKDRMNGGKLTIDRTECSIIMTGTISMAKDLFTSSEDGTLSRWCIYGFTTPKSKNSIRETNTMSINHYYENIISPKILKIIDYWDKEITFEFTNKQWELFESKTDVIYKNMIKSDEKSIDQLLTRNWIMAKRICMILTMIRKYKESISYNNNIEKNEINIFDCVYDGDVISPEDIDVEISLSIISTLIKHMSVIYYDQAELPQKIKGTKVGKLISLIESNDFPNPFEKKDIPPEYSESVVKRAINNLKESGMIGKQGKMAYIKNKVKK